MPTVLRAGPYRVFFYAGDRDEPPHVHVERGENEAKLWLAPVRARTNRRFGRKELRRIIHLVEENQEYLMRSWDEYFGE